MPGRLERVDDGQSYEVFVDYAHTDDALRSTLEVLREITPGKVHLVFGCGGDRDAGKRTKMAEVSETYAAFSFVTLDNPRTESQEKINADIIQGFSGSNYEIISDRKTAVETALSRMDDRCILLVLGKGRENYQEIGTEKQPHNDVEIIREFQHAD